MEIKLETQKKDTSKARANVTKNTATVVSPEINVQSVAAIEFQDKTRKVKRVCVLQCGTVMLQNFTEDLCESGRQLKLIREPDNPYDRWATMVCSLNGTILGYLPSKKNQSVARLMDAGKKILVFVDETLNIPEPAPYRPNNEDARLPLVLYMDIPVTEENEK